jgi:hypothetical protein
MLFVSNAGLSSADRTVSVANGASRISDWSNGR